MKQLQDAIERARQQAKWAVREIEIERGPGAAMPALEALAKLDEALKCVEAAKAQ